MIPVSCLLEVVLDRVRYSRDTKLSILVVLLGVAICTVNDMSVNAKGFVAALIAVWSTSLQQYVRRISIQLISKPYTFRTTFVRIKWILAIFLGFSCLYYSAVCSLSSTEAFNRFFQLIRPHCTASSCFVALSRALHGLLVNEQESRRV